MSLRMNYVRQTDERATKDLDVHCVITEDITLNPTAVLHGGLHCELLQYLLV